MRLQQAHGIVALSVAARRRMIPISEFRFCSKCEGGLEYCKDHLYTHVHVTKGNKEDHHEDKLKIICTMGPNTENEDTRREMIIAGMDVARIQLLARHTRKNS